MVHADFAHDVQDVVGALTDPEFLAERNLSLGELSVECEVEEDEVSTTITMAREVRRVLPGLLAKLFDPVNVMDMTEKWKKSGKGWKGDWTMTVREQPVTIRGSFELMPASDGCRYSVSHRVTAKVPLVGWQIEKYILGQTAKGAEDELEYLRKYLDQN